MYRRLLGAALVIFVTIVCLVLPAAGQGPGSGPIGQVLDLLAKTRGRETNRGWSAAGAIRVHCTVTCTERTPLKLFVVVLCANATTV
jgi:hypothetical protein